jgi:hypothetical protein
MNGAVSCMKLSTSEWFVGNFGKILIDFFGDVEQFHSLEPKGILRTWLVKWRKIGR